MKRVLLVLSLVVFIGALQAEEKNVSYSRSIVKFGGSYTVGDVKPVTIGWRKEVAGPLGLDFNFSPVV